MKSRILNFINELKNSFDGADEVYVSGSCYHLYKVLKTIFPESACYFSNMADHVITKIGDCYYDIKGEVTLVDGYIPIEDHKNYTHETLSSSVFSIYELKPVSSVGINEWVTENSKIK